MKYTIQDVMNAFSDMLDGNLDWWDIQAHTGLSQERCQQIADIYTAAEKGEIEGIPKNSYRT